LQARTGVMQVFSRHIERALNFNRKDPASSSVEVEK
jgi:hypothetical protein